MKPLPIVWQRLVDASGRTCERCDGTRMQVQQAMSTLADVLRPLGLEPTLEVRQIDPATFGANPSESNRIWIAGRSLEDWLGAGVGSSRCCSVCGKSDCRTIEIGTTRFEVVPEKLILRGALAAASQLLDAHELPGRD